MVSYISAGVGVAMVVLIAAAVSGSVCLRKRKNSHVNTTDNVAYHYSSGRTIYNQDTMKTSDPNIITLANDAYGITHGADDVPTSQNEAYAVTDVACQCSGCGMRMKINEAYADMISAKNKDACPDVTQCTHANEVYDYPTSPTSGNDITTSSNDAYGITQEVNDSAISITHATNDVPTSQNEAYQSSGSGMRMKINEAYANAVYDYPTSPTAENDITTSSNDAYGITDGADDAMRMKINEAYADMGSAMNEDASTNVSHCTTVILISTNAAYNAHTSTDEVYDYPTSPT